MKGLDAGRLDRRVTILRVVGEEAAGRMNEKRQVWGEIATVWASVRPVSDSERWQAQEGQEAAVASHRFRIRWGQNVSPLDRLRFDGREYEITGVKELDRRLGQEITAVARAEGI